MKQTSLVKLFIAAGVAVWAIPYAFTALSNALVPLLVLGAIPDTRYTLNPYTMFAAAGFGIAATLTMAIGWVNTAAKRAKTTKAVRSKSSKSNVNVKNVKIASTSQTSNRAKRRLSQQQA
ncbi:MAG TPA: hypothetical protein VGS28_04300 [Candidatus Saccharimonadales bacterium]|nr:hypothetical protein [Candidatus Saccharimonadales bacterium]